MTWWWPIATGSSRRHSRRAVDGALPLGKVFLPDGSYREMTEWVLPPDMSRSFHQGAERLAQLPDADNIKRFFRAGGYWRNFRARYPETDEMYTRMLGISTPARRGGNQSRGRPRLSRNRPPGALPRTVQLPLLAWIVRRSLLAPPEERDLPESDRRSQCAR